MMGMMMMMMMRVTMVKIDDVERCPHYRECRVIAVSGMQVACRVH